MTTAARPLLLVALLWLVGCSRQVLVDSRPPGARLLVDGDFVGYTPISLSLASDTRQVRLQSDGYRTVSGRLERRCDWSGLLALLCPPLLLSPAVVTCLHERYMVVLTPGQGVDEIDTIPAAPDQTGGG